MIATIAGTKQTPRGIWGIARNGIAARLWLPAAVLLVSSTALVAEPVESETVRANESRTASSLVAPIEVTPGETSPAGPASIASVSAFSAAQSEARRVLIAADLGDRNSSESSVRAIQGMFPLLPAPAPQLEAAAAAPEAAPAAETSESPASAAVGRTLRAFERAGEREADQTNQPATRRRASFSNTMSRAAAAGALSLPAEGSIGNALRPARFIPPPSSGDFDPGFSQAADVISIIPGLRIARASFFAGFSSNSVPRSFTQSGTLGRNALNLGADYDLGASIALDYSRVTRRSFTRLSYTPSHVQRSRIPEWSTTDHRLAFQTTRDLTPRLTFSANAGGGNVGLEQFWVEAPTFRTVESAPGDLTELIDAVNAGTISDDEFASILTGAPVVDNPGGAQQDLGRVLSANAGANLSYSYSRRLSFGVGASSNLNQFTGGEIARPLRGPQYVRSAQRSSANVSATYRHSARTQFSFSHRSGLTDSSLVKSITHNPSVSVQQSLSRSWSYRAGIGAGTIRFLESPGSHVDLYRDAALTWTATGRLSYTKEAHSVSLNVSRRIGDPLGLGSRTTTSGGLQWNWQGARNPWGASAGISFSRSQFTRAAPFGGEFMSDFYNAGMRRRLTPSTSFATDYYFGTYESPYQGIASNMTLHRLQMSLVWRPTESRR